MLILFLVRNHSLALLIIIEQDIPVLLFVKIKQFQQPLSLIVDFDGVGSSIAPGTRQHCLFKQCFRDGELVGK